MTGNHKEVAIAIYANSPGLSGSLPDTALRSSTLPYGSPNLLDKMDLNGAFLCFSLNIGQCKTQTADYCLHHTNEYVYWYIVPLFSNPQNNGPQSCSLHFTLPCWKFSPFFSQSSNSFIHFCTY